MAIRREDEGHEKRVDEKVSEQAEPRAIGQERLRPEMVDAATQVIARRRSLLKRLAAYDSGEDIGR